jgi:hypothetical protein
MEIMVREIVREARGKYPDLNAHAALVRYYKTLVVISRYKRSSKVEIKKLLTSFILEAFNEYRSN